MLQHAVFAVNKEPYCIWEVDLAARNREFLEGIDVGYFEYATQAHAETGDSQRASIALRITLHHALETLFSLLGAYTQATDCGYAWIAKCSNKELREFVRRVGRTHNDVFSKLRISHVSWDSIAESVFSSYRPGTPRQVETTQLFAALWARLAEEFLERNSIDEYNALKHGLRVRAGGFALRMAEEKEGEAPPTPDEMQTIGASKHGTSFLRIESLGDKKKGSLRSRQISINWKIEKVTLLLQLVAMSINNVVSALKVANGVKAENCKFLRPQQDLDFELPWRYSPGVTSCSLDFAFDEQSVNTVSRAELLEQLKVLRGYESR